jgi:hypothetical protein
MYMDGETEGRNRQMKVFIRVSVGILSALLLFSLWYSVAANYDYGALAGTYVFRGNGEICTLYLRPDGTFLQELERSGQTQKAAGRWRRYGEAHVSFSSEFVKIENEELNASAEAHGEFQKSFGLFTKLVLAPVPDGPTFYKRWLR